MKKTNIRRAKRMGIAVLLLVCGLGIGLVITPLFKTPPAARRGPSAVAIAKGLATPLPVPDGATLVTTSETALGHSHTESYQDTQLDFSSVRSFVHSVVNLHQETYVPWGGGLSWHCLFILDVTNLTPGQIEAIPDLYKSWFGHQPWFRDNLVNEFGGWESIPWEREEPGLRGPDGSISSMPYGRYPGWSWRRGIRLDSPHLHYEVHVELMDFDTDANSLQSRFPVLSLDAPVRGKRLMYVALSFNGCGLSDVTQVNTRALVR